MVAGSCAELDGKGMDMRGKGHVGRIGKERGSVMMEYVILNLFFIVALVAAGYFFVDPDGGKQGQATYRVNPATGAFELSPRTTKTYGILGDAFVKRYKLMVQIVSMPYP